MTGTGGLGGLQGLIDQWTGTQSGPAGPSVVGEEKPEWFFNTPDGTSNTLPQDVQAMFFRQDAGPSGLNEFLQKEMKTNPGIIDRFRSVINMGLVRPVNQAARQITQGYGGLLAGDQSLLGTMMNGMPSGLNPEYWQQYNNLVDNAIQYQLGLIQQTGYFDNVPTLERDRIMGELAQGWKNLANEEFQNLETQRGNQAQEGLKQQEIDNQNLQRMSELFGGQTVTDPATGQQTWQPTEQATEFAAKSTGWMPSGQATLEREAQAWGQAKDVAQAASNPRDYIYAQMLGNARGGLAGQPATNQLSQNTFAPPTITSPLQFGGQYNQLQNLSTMQGVGAPMGAQAGQQMAMPNAQAVAQPAQIPGGYDWANAANQANQQWQAARQGMQTALQPSAGWAGLTPQQQSTPQGNWPAPTQGQGFQFPQTGLPQNVGFQPGGQPGQSTGSNQPVTVSAFSKALMENRVVPKTGAMQSNGGWSTPQQIQSSFNPNQVRTQDYLRGTNSEQAGFRAVGSLAGYSDEDLQGILKNNLPSFSAPKAGKMI